MGRVREEEKGKKKKRTELNPCQAFIVLQLNVHMCVLARTCGTILLCERLEYQKKRQFWNTAQNVQRQIKWWIAYCTVLL